MNKYTITVNESDAGKFSVARVERAVKINQYRTETKKMPNATFAFADETSATSLTAKRATRRTR